LNVADKEPLEADRMTGGADNGDEQFHATEEDF